MGLVDESRSRENEVQINPGERSGGRAVRRRQQAKKRKQMRKLLTVAAIGLIALWLLTGYVSGIVDVIRLKANIARIEREIDEVNAEIVQLQEEKALVETLEYVEQMARKKLGLVMPGEVKYIVTEVAADETMEKDVEKRPQKYLEPLY